MQNIPEKITQLEVHTDKPAGLLTHQAHYAYQPYIANVHISLTMKRNTIEPFNHGVLHPIFAQNLPEGSNRRYISDRLARVDDMYFLALQGSNGIGMLSYHSEHHFQDAEQISINDILDYKGESQLKSLCLRAPQQRTIQKALHMIGI